MSLQQHYSQAMALAHVRMISHLLSRSALGEQIVEETRPSADVDLTSSLSILLTKDPRFRGFESFSGATKLSLKPNGIYIVMCWPIMYSHRPELKFSDSTLHQKENCSCLELRET